MDLKSHIAKDTKKIVEGNRFQEDKAIFFAVSSCKFSYSNY